LPFHARLSSAIARRPGRNSLGRFCYFNNFNNAAVTAWTMLAASGPVAILDVC
jgi:acetoin utilization deacetylase AcuC-like enzyme